MPGKRFSFGGWRKARGVATRDTSPCPGGNGTTVGSFQKFTVRCGSDVVGDTLDSQDAADFPTCADLCASHHPRCEAVSFDGKKCDLKANLVPEKTHPSRRLDAAIGRFSTASSNCASLGGSQTAKGKNFRTFCGFIINGNDISQSFAPTFEVCMGQCATTTGCGAISYDASQAQGFKNCYLKTTTNTSSNIAHQGVDTAVINAAQASADPAPTSGPVPATTITPTLATTVTSDPAATPVTSAAASFFTPPGIPTGATSVSPVVPVVSTQTVVSVVTFGTQTTAVTETFTMSNSSPAAVGFTFGTMTAAAAESPSTTATTAQDQRQADAGGSRAWIAAPVVGSAAAVVLIVLMFVMLGRRRTAANVSRASSTTSSRKRNMERPSPSSSLFATWLPGSPLHVKSQMGNFSEITGQKVPSRSSMRTSMIGIWRPGAEKLDDIEEDASVDGENRSFATPVYEIKGGRAELRESMSRLGQNRWPPSSSGSR